MLFRAEFRQRWKSWLLLGLLIALVSGLVLAGVSAGRRTAAAFPRFEAAHGYDVFEFALKPLPQIATDPAVASVVTLDTPATGSPTCACTQKINQYAFTLYEVPSNNWSRLVKLVAGTLPDPADPDQVVASTTLQEDGVHVGSVIRVPVAAPSQENAEISGINVTPAGPTLTLHVVGIEVAESEFPGNGSPPTFSLYAGQSLGSSLGQRALTFVEYLVRLRHGANDIPRFEANAQRLGADGSEDQDTPAATVAADIHPQAVGWWLLAGLTALAGLLVLGQALSRQSVVEAQNRASLRSLGVSRRQMVLLEMARTMAIGFVGVSVGMTLAFALSPLAPAGEARLAELSTEFSFDTLVLPLGALLFLVVLIPLALVPALRFTRPGRSDDQGRLVRPSRLVSLLANAGATPSLLIGVRRAVERGRGRDAVPVGSAFLGSILAVAALCATSVFGSSLTHLTTTPTLYGQPFEAFLGTDFLPTASNAVVPALERSPAVLGITGGVSADVRINGTTVVALAGNALRGPLLLTTVNGHLPDADNEITLGASTMREVGASVGSLVKVTAPVPSGGSRTSMFRVVGTTSFPPDFGAGGLGTGAVFTFAGFFAAQCGPHNVQSSCERAATTSIGGTFLLHFAPDAAGRSVLHQLTREYPGTLEFPVTPENLVNFGEAVNFPLILGLVFIVFGISALIHVLVVSVVRRRREVGLLKTLGFVRSQIAFSVWWQSVTIALVGIVVGVPVGVAAGRVIWQAFAGNLGVLPQPIVVVWAIAAVAAGALVVANILAVAPAVVASRSRPALLLRSE
jgi:ABC-type lipoprotein release transport system permease subunit